MQINVTVLILISINQIENSFSKKMRFILKTL